MAAALQKDRYGQSSDATAPDWAAMAAGAWGASSRKSAAREYHGARQRSGGKPPQSPDPQLLALLDPAISLEPAQRRLLERRRGGAAASTVEALVYSLRRDLDALAEADAVRRLTELSDDQLLEVGERLRRFKPSIKLTLDRAYFEVLLPERFNPSELKPPYYSLRSRGNFTCVQNPVKSDLPAGRYFPRLTLIKQQIAASFRLTLRIEFSAPKLLLANNLDELESSCSPKLIAQAGA
jgi:hypothetical protein